MSVAAIKFDFWRPFLVAKLGLQMMGWHGFVKTLQRCAFSRQNIRWIKSPWKIRWNCDAWEKNMASKSVRHQTLGLVMQSCKTEDLSLPLRAEAGGEGKVVHWRTMIEDKLFLKPSILLVEFSWWDPNSPRWAVGEIFNMRRHGGFKPCR